MKRLLLTACALMLMTLPAMARTESDSVVTVVTRHFPEGKPENFQESAHEAKVIEHLTRENIQYLDGLVTELQQDRLIPSTERYHIHALSFVNDRLFRVLYLSTRGSVVTIDPAKAMLCFESVRAEVEIGAKCWQIKD